MPISDLLRSCTGTVRPKDTIELRQSGARLRLLSIPVLNGSLTTTCVPRGQVVVDTNDQHRATFTVPASGIVTLLNLTEGEGDLQPGDTILVGCQNRNGGAQLKRYIVP